MDPQLYCSVAMIFDYINVSRHYGAFDIFWKVTFELLCAGVRLFSGSLGSLPYDSWFQLVRVSVMYFVHQLLFCTHTLGGICYSQNEHTIEFIRLRMATDISLALQLSFQDHKGIFSAWILHMRAGSLWATRELPKSSRLLCIKVARS